MSTSYCSRLHDVKTKRDKHTAQKKRKSTSCTRRWYLNNKPIKTLEFITITRFRYKRPTMLQCWLLRSSKMLWSCHHMQHWNVCRWHLRKKKTWTELCPEKKAHFTNIFLCLFFFVLVDCIFVSECRHRLIDLFFTLCDS